MLGKAQSVPKPSREEMGHLLRHENIKPIVICVEHFNWSKFQKLGQYWLFKPITTFLTIFLLDIIYMFKNGADGEECLSFLTVSPKKVVIIIAIFIHSCL